MKSSFLNIKLINISIFRYILLVQFILLFACATASYFIGGLQAVLWSVIASLLLVIANLFFGIKIFRYRGASKARKIFSSLAVGWIGKIIISISGFLVAFTYMESKYAVFFISSLIVVSFSQLIALLLCKKK